MQGTDVDFKEHLASRRALIDAALDDAVVDTPLCPPRLAEAMRYSLKAGGKRLRPVLALLACEACGGQKEEAVPVAIAAEMIHTYSLIHDDLPAMDNDDLRRGRPTNHRVFGEATAILAGDALLSRSFEIIAREVSPAKVAADCIADLAAAAGPEGMVGGQAADLAAETSGVRDQEHLESIHLRKTGALIQASLVMGARVGGGSKSECQAMKSYGRAVGLAFQIADDLLDITGDAAKMGKGVRKDADHNKLTYPGLLGLEQSQKLAARLTEEAIAVLSPFGKSGRPLAAVARFAVERDH
ncbi:polyprenyl synthetase family protein [Stratiformator vulcanicus]|uniref:Farnesyl diphosphate synthase n=1 Tax=Stratiformator vulcanicus TaxID=2527980 RepID=A0A517R5C8_9PLAN|nr:farnesyl diphosphate synthase [Stratiformator vulcanicus]QDT39091.1 Farnesyl diphosphate synthase [Stratiformator vulcanicus]